MFTWDSSVKETSVTTGTGVYTLDGAVTGYNAFAGMGLNNQCPYHARMGSNYEEGIGQILGSPARLQRITILRSSNANAAVNWGAGTKTVRCVMPAKLAAFRGNGAAIASAATLDLSAVVGDYCAVTGTVTVDAITLPEGREVTVVFNSALQLTHSASLLLPGSVNLTTVAGQAIRFRGQTGGVVKALSSRSWDDSALATKAEHAADLRHLVEGRLTLQTLTPVPTADQLAKTLLFFTPFNGNRIGLYDGTKWVQKTLTQRQLTVPATTNTMYDVFLYDNAGVLTLEAVAWTDDSNRATGLASQDGILVKTGEPTKRYLGSFRTTGVSGQTEDSLAKRYVWNCYNRRSRPMRVIETANTWTYTTDAWRQANANAANQLDFVLGLSEDEMEAIVLAGGTNSVQALHMPAGIGMNSTTVNSAAIYLGIGSPTSWSSSIARYRGVPPVGRTFLAWLERSQVAGVTTWAGDNGLVSLFQSGISGRVWA